MEPRLKSYGIKTQVKFKTVKRVGEKFQKIRKKGFGRALWPRSDVRFDLVGFGRRDRIFFFFFTFRRIWAAVWKLWFDEACFEMWFFFGSMSGIYSRFELIMVVLNHFVLLYWFNKGEFVWLSVSVSVNFELGKCVRMCEYIFIIFHQHSKYYN